MAIAKVVTTIPNMHIVFDEELNRLDSGVIELETVFGRVLGLLDDYNRVTRGGLAKNSGDSDEELGRIIVNLRYDMERMVDSFNVTISRIKCKKV